MFATPILCSRKMDVAKVAWAQRYRRALRLYLKQGRAATPLAALRLGRQAASLGMETLDVGRIHRQAIAALALSARPASTKQAAMDRASRFFAEATVPIERTHDAARQSSIRVDRLVHTLRRRKLEAAATARQLNRCIARRRLSEAALTKSRITRARLSTEAQHLQKHLRRLTHANLLAHERGRLKFSRRLDDDAVQMLLALNVRLLSLDKAVKASAASLKKEIAGTQQLVRESVKGVRRSAHALEDTNGV